MPPGNLKKKRKPLRNTPQSAEAQRSSEVKAVGNKRGQSLNEVKKAKRTKREEDSEESSDDDESEDEKESGDDEESPLTKEMTEEYTFEFNDMKEEYSAGIKMILASLLVTNPSLAYQLSDKIILQGTFTVETSFLST